MSVKNDLAHIKDEFNKDGQILENAFRFEIFLRRYKKTLITLLVLIIAWAVYLGVDSYLTQQRHIQANEAYTELLSGEQTPELLEKLEKNSPILYNFYVYTHNPSQEALKKLMDSDNELIAHIATYRDITHTLDSLLEESNQDTINEVLANLPPLKDKTLQQWLILQEAAILLQKGYTQEAKDKLMLLDENSEFARIGESLRHYK